MKNLFLLFFSSLISFFFHVQRTLFDGYAVESFALWRFDVHVFIIFVFSFFWWHVHKHPSTHTDRPNVRHSRMRTLFSLHLPSSKLFSTYTSSSIYIYIIHPYNPYLPTYLVNTTTTSFSSPPPSKRYIVRMSFFWRAAVFLFEYFFVCVRRMGHGSLMSTMSGLFTIASVSVSFF